jgi:hypothetical protein
MKAYLSFDLDKPEDRDLHKDVMQASDLKYAMQDFERWLRAQDKHTNKVNIKIKEVREQFFECLRERDLDLW